MYSYETIVHKVGRIMIFIARHSLIFLVIAIVESIIYAKINDAGHPGVLFGRNLRQYIEFQNVVHNGNFDTRSAMRKRLASLAVLICAVFSVILLLGAMFDIVNTGHNTAILYSYALCTLTVFLAPTYLLTLRYFRYRRCLTEKTFQDFGRR